MFGSSTSNTDPLSSKRFLAFLTGVFLAYLIGTKKITHLAYLTVIGVLVYTGRHALAPGINLQSMMVLFVAGFICYAWGMEMGDQG